MPFVQLHLQKGKNKEVLQQISKTIHQAIVDKLNVPKEDYFQVIRQYEPDEFFYDPTFLNIDRSDDLIYIYITLKNTRTAEQKKAFYAELAETLHTKHDVRKEDVFIVLVGNDDADWSFGNGQG